MFKVRLRSSIVLMAVTIFLMVTGGDILFAGMAAISLIGMMELYRTLDFHKTLLAAVSYVAARGLLCVAPIRAGGIFPPILYRVSGTSDGRVRADISEVRGRSGDERILWPVLRGDYDLLYLSDPYGGERRVPGMADLHLFLGLRYDGVLHGHADRQA